MDPDTQTGTSALPSAAEVASRFRQRLVVFAFRRLGDRALADDAAQETLRRIVEALAHNKIRDAGALPAFVFQTARHVCQQWLRKRGREHRAFARYAAEDPAPVVIADHLDALVGAERRTAVRQALAALGSDDRNLLQSFYGLGLTIAEVAARLGIAEGAVRVRKHRALKRLGKQLDGDEIFATDREL